MVWRAVGNRPPVQGESSVLSVLEVAGGVKVIRGFREEGKGVNW